MVVRHTPLLCLLEGSVCAKTASVVKCSTVVELMTGGSAEDAVSRHADHLSGLGHETS